MMKKYIVEITETLQKQIEIDAKSESEATTKTDSVEEKTIKLTGKAKPRSIDGKFDIVMDANHIPDGTDEQFNQAFDKFFTGVLLPDGTFSPAQ